MIGLIFNPLCRLGHSKSKIAKFKEKLNKAGLEYEYRETNGPGHATELAKELAETCDIIVSAGGDGTLHEIVNGVYDKDVKIVVLPYGSGNDLSISIYGKDPSDEEIIHIIKNGVEKHVDIAMVNDTYIMDMMTAFGLIVSIQEKYLEYGGSYLRAIPLAIKKRLPRSYTININGEVKIVRSEMIAAMNCKTAGGGLVLDRHGDVADGEMELVILHDKSRWRRARNLGAILAGRFNEQSNVETIKFRECTICPEEQTLCNLDGELIRIGETHIKVLDKKLVFLVNADRPMTSEGILASLKPQDPRRNSALP